MLKPLPLALLGLALLLFDASPSRAEHFRFVSGQIPPFAIGSEDTLHAGIAIDIIQAVFQDMGHTVEIEVYPWPRALKNVQTGQYDGIFPLFKTPEREKFLTYPDQPLVSMGLAFFTQKNSSLQDITLDDAFDYSIVKVRRASMGEKFATAAKGFEENITEVNNTQTALKMLTRGRVDLFSSVTDIAMFNAKELGMDSQIKSAGPIFDTLLAYLAFSKSSGKSINLNAFNWTMIKLKQNGTLHDIYAKYLSEDSLKIQPK
ncbi:transporter substrate-binding domain-containing protein [Magnetovibrio sp. PR-2]|uniref:substrate-binding periplasmic protein n=1 Tax=Magnetovibrio sp. PR-2 TaxID=3120356 RepID=UPI002FCDF153